MKIKMLAVLAASLLASSFAFADTNPVSQPNNENVASANPQDQTMLSDNSGASGQMPNEAVSPSDEMNGTPDTASGDDY